VKNCAERSCALPDGHGGMCRSMLDAYDARILRYGSECLAARVVALEEALRTCFQQLQDQQAMPDESNFSKYRAALAGHAEDCACFYCCEEDA